MLELAGQFDREAVNALAEEVHAMHVAWRPDLYRMPQELYPQERFDEAVKQRQLYCAKIDGVVAGYALLKIRDVDAEPLVKRRVMLIEEFCVDQICRGQGIGTQMVMEIRVLARAFRCTDLQLGVYPQNDDAVGFWQKCGFMIQSINMQCKL